MAIPKTIHYCWFGGNKKPTLAKKCIKSWEKYCPDYKVIEWNEDNFNISIAPLFVRQAYEAKKWAFVTDYVRLFVLVNYGGIYMDTDVELIKPLDAFLSHDAFSGFEDNVLVPTGIMACKKNFSLFSDFLHYYDDVCFINPDGSLNNTPNVHIMTNICIEHGLIQNNQYQVVDGFALYPNEYFCPLECESGRLHKTAQTVAIHWFMGSWLSQEKMKKRIQNKNKIKRHDRIHNILHIPNRILQKILGVKRYESLKKRLKS